MNKFLPIPTYIVLFSSLSVKAQEQEIFTIGGKAMIKDMIGMIEKADLQWPRIKAQ